MTKTDSEYDNEQRFCMAEISTKLDYIVIYILLGVKYTCVMN